MNATLPPPVPNNDREHLKLIEIFHYVIAGLNGVGLGFLFLHYMILHTVFTNPQVLEQMRSQQVQQGQQMPFDPAQFFGLFVWIYVFLGALLVVLTVLNVASGLCIRRRSARMFSLVVAGVNCVCFPFGTALGIFTFILLLRSTVAALYGETAPR